MLRAFKAKVNTYEELTITDSSAPLSLFTGIIF